VSEQAFHDSFYGGDAERIFSSPLYRQLLDRHVAFLIEVTPRAATARVLSVGCGDGRREIALARHVGHIAGIDLSPVAIDHACRRANAVGAHNVEFRVADARQIGDSDGAGFDAVWCPGVLHHLPDDQIVQLLTAVKSLLKPTGRLVTMDPNARRAVNLFKPLFRRRYTKFHSDGERELDPRAVAAMIEAAGLAVIEIRFTDAFISPLAWMFPRLPEALASRLARLDQLLVNVPFVQRLSSGFAVVAEHRERPTPGR
jgi:SAM-dependent methyltransferase